MFTFFLICIMVKFLPVWYITCPAYITFLFAEIYLCLVWWRYACTHQWRVAMTMTSNSVYVILNDQGSTRLANTIAECIPAYDILYSDCPWRLWSDLFWRSYLAFQLDHIRHSRCKITGNTVGHGWRYTSQSIAEFRFEIVYTNPGSSCYLVLTKIIMDWSQVPVELSQLPLTRPRYEWITVKLCTRQLEDLLYGRCKVNVTHVSSGWHDMVHRAGSRRARALRSRKARMLRSRTVAGNIDPTASIYGWFDCWSWGWVKHKALANSSYFQSYFQAKELDICHVNWFRPLSQLVKAR